MIPPRAQAGRQVVVGVADLRVSGDVDEVLVTYALGSCLGVVVHDPAAQVGGMLHVMLPDSSIDPLKAQAVPAMFVDTGVPALFRACYKLGARKERMILKVAGGAQASGLGTDGLEIGRRNVVALRRLLWRNGVMPKRAITGGNEPRTMRLEVGTGRVTIRTAAGEETI